MGIGLLWVGSVACGPAATEDGGEGEGTSGSSQTGDSDGSDGSDDSDDSLDGSGGSVDNACECQPEPGEIQFCESGERALLAPGCGFDEGTVLYEIDCVWDDMEGTEDAVLTCSEGDPDAKAAAIAALQSGGAVDLVVATDIFWDGVRLEAYALHGDGTGTTIHCSFAHTPPVDAEVWPLMFTPEAVVGCLQMTDVVQSADCIGNAVTLAQPLAACE